MGNMQWTLNFIESGLKICLIGREWTFNIESVQEGSTEICLIGMDGLPGVVRIARL